MTNPQNAPIPAPSFESLLRIEEIQTLANADIAHLEWENYDWFARMARTRAARAADVLRMVFSGADSVVVAIYDHTTDIVAALAEDGTLVWYTPLIFTRSQVAEDHRVAFNAVDGLLHDLIGNPAIGEALPLAQPLLDPQVSSKIGVFGDLHRVLSLRPGGYEATAAASS